MAAVAELCVCVCVGVCVCARIPQKTSRIRVLSGLFCSRSFRSRDKQKFLRMTYSIQIRATAPPKKNNKQTTTTKKQNKTNKTKQKQKPLPSETNKPLADSPCEHYTPPPSPSPPITYLQEGGANAEDATRSVRSCVSSPATHPFSNQPTNQPTNQPAYQTLVDSSEKCHSLLSVVLRKRVAMMLMTLQP